jgi:helicase
MRIDEIPLEKRFIDLFNSEGIVELYPPQELLVNSGILAGCGNVVLATPTASGKTFSSEIAFSNLLDKKK